MPSLLYNALKCSKYVDSKSCSWYSSIKQSCSVLDIKLESSSQSKFRFKKILKKNIDKTFLDEWYNKRREYTSGKLDTYCKLKTHFGCEKYIDEIRNFNHRRSRVANHVTSDDRVHGISESKLLDSGNIFLVFFVNTCQN